MNIHLSRRLLAHSIDAATLTADRSKRGGWGGTFALLTATLVVCSLLIWADRTFV